MVSDSLRMRGYSVACAESGDDAQLCVDELRPDLIVLDIMLPDRSGLTLCPRLKRSTGAPIILCSATRRQDDAVIGLELGADDFVRKPFPLQELEARIDLALRRGPAAARPASAVTEPLQKIGDLRIDTGRCEARAGGRLLQLTPTEFRLLSLVAGRSPDVVPRQELAASVWESIDEGVIRSLDVHMRRLRTKLAAAAPSPRLATRRGFGYQLLDDTHPPLIATDRGPSGDG
jgi:DNA-binding response OmpR family regulator